MPRGDTRGMQMSQNTAAASANRLAAAALAALGAASAIPIPLAQLDFAGMINVFHIDSGDSPQALAAAPSAASTRPRPDSNGTSQPASLAAGDDDGRRRACFGGWASSPVRGSAGHPGAPIQGG
jgi:hypothetical protein